MQIFALLMTLLAGTPAAAPGSEQDRLDEMLGLLEELNSSVTTATRTPHRVEEVPGLVTVIGHDEIRAMGARTLADVLWVVPGFSHVQDNNEHIVAVHGISATTNNKLLVLRDGHRLNEFLFENVEPDYSISLGNVDRIEIVRGPGASLYGNASLTVVNIITEDGGKSRDRNVSVSVGDHGQAVLGGTWRSAWETGHVMVFGQYAYVQGETVEVEPAAGVAQGLRNQAMVDAYPHNFDVGMKLVEGGLTLSGSVRRSAYVQPMGNVGQVVDQSEGYDACADRIREGKQASGSCDDLLLHRLEQSFLYASLGLVYEREVGPVKLALRHAFDHSTYESWQLRRSPRELPPHGNLFSLNWEGYRGGIDYSGFYAWKSGNALVGLAAERRELTGSFYQANQPDPAVFSRGELVPPGAEHSIAGYLQVQQRLFEVLHLNGGLRYDYFEGFGGSFNPRAAITYMPVELVSLKLIYARAFQAPTYFYRMSNPALGYGSSEDLQAETFDSVQAAVRVGQGARWSGEVAYYFNRLDNLISRDPSVSPAVYRNFGKLTVHGVEADGRFHLGMVTAFANYTFLQPIAGETREGLLLHGSIPYVSAHTVNAGVTVRPLSYLSLNTYGSWHSRASAPVSAVTSEGMPARFLLNGTVAAENLLPGVRLALSVHNILGTRYDQGGSVPPFPQAGRWFRLTAEYSFQ